MLVSSLLLLIVPFVAASRHHHSQGISSSQCPDNLKRASLPSAASRDFATVVGDNKHPEAVAIGVGVQNYTCSSAGTYSSIGAVATLFDVSCLLEQPIFDSLTTIATNMSSPSVLSTPSVQAYTMGHHYFIMFNSTLSPRFDLSHQADVPAAQYIVAKKSGDVASPDGSSNVDWLQLTAISGTAAHTVYRISTSAGQPPKFCTPGSSPNVSMNYAAQYWFFASKSR